MKLRHLIPLLCLAATAQAGTVSYKNPAPVAPAPAESGWWFRAAPYLWVTAIDGDAGIGPLHTPVDVSMKDTLDSLDMGYMFLLEAGYDRVSFGVDAIYGKFSQDIAAGGRVFDSFRFEQKQWVFTPFIAWRAVESGGNFLDVFAGARVNVLEAEITGRFVGPGEVSATADKEWVDPIIGLRGQAALGDRLFLRGNADIGGFGVSSELVWQAFVGLGCHLSDHASVAIGYRGLGVDYSRNALTLDTVTHGPVVGLEMRW